jgi:hypothetical protein
MKKQKQKPPVYINGLMHHHFRFGLKQNIKVATCRIFGHQINNNVEHKWCERCGLFYGEIYHKQEDWEEHI